MKKDSFEVIITGTNKEGNKQTFNYHNISISGYGNYVENNFSFWKKIIHLLSSLFLGKMYFINSDFKFKLLAHLMMLDNAIKLKELRNMSLKLIPTVSDFLDINFYYQEILETKGITYGEVFWIKNKNNFDTLALWFNSTVSKNLSK
jgi:hypothetical protein